MTNLYRMYVSNMCLSIYTRYPLPNNNCNSPSINSGEKFRKESEGDDSFCLIRQLINLADQTDREFGFGPRL